MKNLLIIFALIFVFTNSGTAQMPTVAVGSIKIFGIHSNSIIVSKLVRLELIKIEKYSVLDQFDMKEVEDSTISYDDCFGRDCLLEFGEKLKVDYMVSGKIDGLGAKIVVSLKLIDISTGEIVKNKNIEFTNNEAEIQRMIGIVIQEMHGIVPDPIVKKRLVYNNDPIIATNLGQISNAGPRVGVGYTVGSLNEFVTRSESRGGMGIIPVVTNIGYQFELQYVGTENFSGLFEFIPMLTGLEQGQFIPSMLFLNGFRFGKGGWEIAFGPNFGLNKTSKGFIDDKGDYWSESDYLAVEGNTHETLKNSEYEIETFSDTRGDLKLSTRWVVGVGRTFRSGALNVPINVFYSSQKDGGMLGLSVGFNITKGRKIVN
ncbi:hypothetical protein JYT74_02615 [Crocinitomix catalasitica]|nr:hypothetical protein [Crocinitomix catalasitica]